MGRQRDFSEMREIRGLKELQSELRKGGPEMAKKLQQVNKELVVNVARKAQARVYPSVSAADGRAAPLRQRPSGPGSIGRTRASIRGSASQRDARVVAGGPKAPGFYGHEFGGGARPSTRQFPVHRGVDGYFLYPTVREEVKHASRNWNRIFDEVFPE